MKYLGSIIGDSVITCDEIIEVTKTITKEAPPTNFNKKGKLSKIKRLYFTHLFINYSSRIDNC